MGLRRFFGLFFQPWFLLADLAPTIYYPAPRR
jgi:hypothetical protein